MGYSFTMSNITRFYLSQMSRLLAAGRVLAIYGPRRAGKTTLIKQFLAGYAGKYFSGVGEDSSVCDVLASSDLNRIRSFFSGYELVVIDEAQAIPQVGRGLKLLVDHLPEVAVIASGSSSFQLAGEIGEPLTGRKRTITLLPISAIEVREQWGAMAVLQRLDEVLIYGSYPEVLLAENIRDKQRLLCELRDSYLFKDILSFEKIRSAHKLQQLVRLLAFQVGKEVSLEELANALQINRRTVERYLDLLEKTFVIFRISGFSRNLRSEVTRTKRIYFYDNGVLNAVLNNFNAPELRPDMGGLWENFLALERLKKQGCHAIAATNYFWRTYQKQEIDWVEECNGVIHGFEFKYGTKQPKEAPRLWRETYPAATWAVINKSTFGEFIL